MKAAVGLLNLKEIASVRLRDGAIVWRRSIFPRQTEKRAELKGGQELTGRMTDRGEDSFIITKNTEHIRIAYSDVVKVRRTQSQHIATSFEQLQVLVKPGSKISVIDFTGKKTKGKIVDLSSSS